MQFDPRTIIIRRGVEADHAVIFVIAYALISSFIGEFVSAGHLIREFRTPTAYFGVPVLERAVFSLVSAPIAIKR